jgi:hypothetical protein
MTKILSLQSLSRQTVDGDTESLHFTPGVNTIVGRKDAGKTVWLKMLDFLLGDTGSPESAFGKLADKYVSVSASADVRGETIELERRWKEPNAKGKIFVNGDPLTTKEFSNYILPKLEIPILHFPQGNPFSERAWPELSWRILFRHIYRQERFWSDLADNQPESEQFAALMQFLGVAEKLFPQQLGDVVGKRKELFTLAAKKEQFQEIVDNITSKMTAQDGGVDFATAQLISEKISQHEEKVQRLLEERQILIGRALSASHESSNGQEQYDVKLAEERALLSSELDDVFTRRTSLGKRLSDMRLLFNSVKDEVERLKRSQLAGTFLDDLKITHCPACDQEVDYRRSSEGQCFLCLQPMSDGEGSERLEFEIHQMESERKELTELISKLESEGRSLESQESRVRERLSIVNRRLEPIRSSIGALVDPQLSALDAERGRIEEQIENYNRILSLLDYRDELSKQIDELNTQIAELDTSLDVSGSELNLESASDDLSDAMMTYLNKLNQGNPDRWKKGRVEVQLSERRFAFKIHGASWKGEVGATTACYFLLAYHYALLSLTFDRRYHYPGLCIIDFPPSLPDGTLIADLENFLIEPFVSLLKHYPDYPAQMIVAGRAFENLQGVSRIELDTVWT